MSEGAFWTKGKLVGGAILAIGGSLTLLLGGARTIIGIVDAPDRLTAHEEAAAAKMAEFERRMEASRLRFCEELGLFPSECPEFTIEHGEDR